MTNLHKYLAEVTVRDSDPNHCPDLYVRVVAPNAKEARRIAAGDARERLTARALKRGFGVHVMRDRDEWVVRMANTSAGARWVENERTGWLTLSKTVAFQTDSRREAEIVRKRATRMYGERFIVERAYTKAGVLD